MLKKFYRSLGDTPWEFFGNLLILILLGPIWLVLNVVVYIGDCIYQLLRLPAPRQIPTVVSDDGITDKQKAEVYVAKIEECVKNVGIVTSQDPTILTTKLSSKHASVEVWLDDYAVGISIDGLNTGYWHTAEEKNLDLFFWAAIGALHNGIKWKRNWIGRNEGWIYSDEMEVWVVVSAASGFSEYYKFRRHYKRRIV